MSTNNFETSLKDEKLTCRIVLNVLQFNVVGERESEGAGIYAGRLVLLLLLLLCRIELALPILTPGRTSSAGNVQLEYGA